MSRNIRQKFPRTPVKPPQKRRGSDSSSSLNLSDDDGYSGVEDISDSEDDEDGVAAAEEEHIIHNALRISRTAVSPRPHTDDDADEEDDDIDDEEDDEVDENGSDESDEFLSDDNNADHSDVWNGISPDVEDAAEDRGIAGAHHNANTVKRQVRFTGVPDSDSDSTTSDATDDVSFHFPDLFVAQSSLDPAFRQELERDPDDGSSNDSFWDFRDVYGLSAVTHMTGAHLELCSDDDMAGTTPKSSQTPTAASTPIQAVGGEQDLDGYDSEGDTTEEDVPEPPARRKLRRVKTVAESDDSDTDRPIRLRSGRPRATRFDLDSPDSKPIAFMHPVSRKMIIFTPDKSRGFDLAPESFRDLQFLPLDPLESSPIATSSGSLMMAAMLSTHTFGDLVNSLPFGPEEAFLPSANTVTNLGDESDFSGVYDQDDEAENGLQIEDFIQFNQETSGDEEELEDAESPDWADDVDADNPSTPCRRPSTASTAVSPHGYTGIEMHPLLAHFDNTSDGVGSYRLNQANQQLILSETASTEALSFSGPYSIGTLKGIKEGSLQAVTTPITPVRRQKRGSMNGLSGLPDINGAPLEAVAQKRKAAEVEAEGNHKRHRSISDVRHIAL